MARISDAIRQLALHLCAHEALGQERRIGSGVRTVAVEVDRTYPYRSLQPGLDLGQGTT